LLGKKVIFFMEKPAITTLDIHPLIKKRWSPRAFANREVSTEQLELIFEAARWAPSSFNEQPWRFIVGRRGDNTYQRILDTLVEFNQKWSHTAEVLAITVVKKSFTKNGKPNRVCQFDLGQSLAYITFQAYDLGLVMHQMAGLRLEKATEVFAIPDDYEPVTAFALGYQGNPDILPEDLRKSEYEARQRKPRKEFVFKETFGKSFF
jgi:nitroreductase